MIGATDLDGNPRIVGDIVDMGAYEWVPEPSLFIILQNEIFAVDRGNKDFDELGGSALLKTSVPDIMAQMDYKAIAVTFVSRSSVTALIRENQS